MLRVIGHTCPIAWKPIHFVRPPGECSISAPHRKLTQTSSLQTYGNALFPNVSSTSYNGTWVCLLMNARNAILQRTSLRPKREYRLMGMYAESIEALSCSECYLKGHHFVASPVYGLRKGLSILWTVGFCDLQNVGVGGPKASLTGCFWTAPRHSNPLKDSMHGGESLLAQPILTTKQPQVLTDFHNY